MKSLLCFAIALSIVGTISANICFERRPCLYEFPNKDFMDLRPITGLLRAEYFGKQVFYHPCLSFSCVGHNDSMACVQSLVPGNFHMIIPRGATPRCRYNELIYRDREDTVVVRHRCNENSQTHLVVTDMQSNFYTLELRGPHACWKKAKVTSQNPRPHVTTTPKSLASSVTTFLSLSSMALGVYVISRTFRV